jgi:protein-disulfide isomerase
MIKPIKWMKTIGLTSLLMFSASTIAAEDKAIEAAVQKEIKRMLASGEFDDAIQNGIQNYLVKAQRDEEERKAQAAIAQAKKVRPIDPKRDHIEGNPDAIVSLIEYSDFECPFCKRHHANVQKLIEQNKGKVNWVYRHFPLDFHNPGAASQAEGTECAAKLGGNDAFWKFTHAIYDRTTSGGKGFPISKLAPLAAEIGLDKAKFEECLNSGEMKQRVQDDIENGLEAGVRGTPGGIMINNKTGEVLPTPGALPVSRLQASVNKLLKSK